MTPITVEEAMQIALGHHRAGRLAEAEVVYRQLLARFPDHPDALQLLGILAGQQGNTDAAIELIGRAIALEPTVAEHYSNLGEFYHRAGQADQAIASFRRAVELKPGLKQAHTNLVKALKSQGRLHEVIDALGQAIVLWPLDAQLHADRGALFLQADRDDEAIAALNRALALAPGHAEAHGNLGVAWHRAGQLDRAIAACRRATECDPDHALAHYNLLLALQESGRIDQGCLDSATACFRRALARDPGAFDVLKMLARALAMEGKALEARQVIAQALLVRPGAAGLKIRSALLLPVVYKSVDELEQERLRVEQSLERLSAETLTINDPVLDVGSSSFYLAYQGENDRDLQVRLAGILRNASPDLDFVAPHARAPGSPSGRAIRVGFLSAYFQDHTIAKLNQGFVRNLSREHFAVTLLRYPGPDDVLARLLAQSADHVVTLPRKLAIARQQIADLELDVLYYPEIGMDPRTYYLAHARLAPVQCAAWGHPVTTGLPTIDYFLSSRLLEPEDASDHYLEKVVKFNNLNVYYYEPRLEGPVRDRAAFGLESGTTLYVCPQSLFKIHPDFDAVLGAILRGDTLGRLVLIEGSAAHWTKLLTDRFRRSFPDVADRVVFLPRLSQADFLHLQACADVLLDTTHFGGGNTSYEAFTFGTPIVTRAGRFLRDRITYACYQQMGVLDCIAQTDAEYVAIALGLGTDRAWRDRVCAKILACKHRVYEDMTVVRELEQFLLEAVQRAAGSSTVPPCEGGIQGGL